MKKILILFSLILIFLVTITTPTKKVNADDTPCEVSITPVEEYKDKIKVHAVDKSSGQRIQRIDIYYTAVGLIDVSQHIQELAI